MVVVTLAGGGGIPTSRRLWDRLRKKRKKDPDLPRISATLNQTLGALTVCATGTVQSLNDDEEVAESLLAIALLTDDGELEGIALAMLAGQRAEILPPQPRIGFDNAEDEEALALTGRD